MVNNKVFLLIFKHLPLYLGVNHYNYRITINLCLY